MNLKTPTSRILSQLTLATLKESEVSLYLQELGQVVQTANEIRQDMQKSSAVL